MPVAPHRAAFGARVREPRTGHGWSQGDTSPIVRTSTAPTSRASSAAPATRRWTSSTGWLRHWTCPPLTFSPKQRWPVQPCSHGSVGLNGPLPESALRCRGPCCMPWGGTATGCISVRLSLSAPVARQQPRPGWGGQPRHTQETPSRCRPGVLGGVKSGGERCRGSVRQSLVRLAGCPACQGRMSPPVHS